MINADKVFKGTTQVSKIYQGQNLVWEQPVVKSIRWDPTTHIYSDAYQRTFDDPKETDHVTLYVKGYTSITITMYLHSNSQREHYIYAWKLDDKSSSAYIKLTRGSYSSNSISHTYSIPNDSLEHFIYFEIYSGRYVGKTTEFEISYSKLV